MAKTINLAMTNEIGVAAAKARIARGFDELKADHGDKVGAAEMTWRGDTAHVSVKAMGLEIAAEIAVTAEAITLVAALPWLLAGMSGTIETIITERARALKASPPTAA